MLDDGIDRGNHRLAAFAGEALLADVLGVEETLEKLGLVDAAQDADLFGLGEAGLIARRLHLRLQPATHVDILDVGVLDTDVAAIGGAERGDDLTELHLAAAEVGADIEAGVEVGFGKVELGQRELGVGGGRRAERIEMSLEVTDAAISVDQVMDIGLLQAVDDGRGGSGRALGGDGTGKGGGRGGAGAAQGEALEEGAPSRVDRVGILQPGLVGRLDDGGIGMRGKGGGRGGGHGGTRGGRETVENRKGH